MSTSLQKYLTSVRGSILEAEEENKLIKLFQSKSKGWEDAQEKIVKSNSLYIVKLAYSFAQKNEEILDLISEGNLALLESLVKFDPNKEARLLSYASYRIKGAMLAYRKKQNLFFNFKVSGEVSSLAKKAKEYILDFKLKHNQNPSVSSIAKHCGIKESKALLIAELADINVLSIDNEKVRVKQIKRLKDIKDSRDINEVNNLLKKVTEASRSSELNLLEVCVEAAKKRCTVGEMTEAMEKVFGRHTLSSKTISGVYGKAIKHTEKINKIDAEIEKFIENKGRRPRMLVVKMGQDGHDRGAKLIATAFSDLGFDVDVGPLFQTPEEAAMQAIDNDVHIIGVSTLAAGHKTLVPLLMKSLKNNKASNIKVICGGVIPPQDYDALYELGVSKVFGPGTNIQEAAIEIINII